MVENHRDNVAGKDMNPLEQQALRYFDTTAISIQSQPFTTLPSTREEMILERTKLVRMCDKLGSEHALEESDRQRLYFLLDACHLVERAGVHPEELQGLSPTQLKFLNNFYIQMVDLPNWGATRTDYDLLEEIAEFHMEGLRLMNPQGRAIMHEREEQEIAHLRVLQRLGEHAKNQRIRSICMRWMGQKDEM